jgi:sulfur-oxidizing protein SoxX
MFNRIVLAMLVLAVFGLWACTPGGNSDPDMVTILLPEGDVEAGRQAFIDLQCSACHLVAGVDGLPDPVAKIPIPDLGKSLAQQPRGALASSLIVPSHIDSAAAELWTDWSDQQRVWLGPGQQAPQASELADDEPALSLMSDYRDTMTVKQLSDLVAFLQDSAE